MTIKITANDKGSPVGKLADAELYFNDGPLAGLKLIGFSIWEQRAGKGRNVTFPSRVYSVSGERRSFALLRAHTDFSATESIRDLILRAYAEHTGERPTTPDPANQAQPDPFDQADGAPTPGKALSADQQLADVVTRMKAGSAAALRIPATVVVTQAEPPLTRTTPAQAVADVAAGKPILLTSLIPQRAAPPAPITPTSPTSPTTPAPSAFQRAIQW